MRRVLVVVLICGCGRQPAPPSPPASPPSGSATTTPSPAPPPPAPPAPPAAPAPAAGDLVVVARIVDAGPIGDGRCSQRSYEIVVDHVVSGAAPADARFWVHFEACGVPRAVGAPGNLAGTGLVTGASYRLALRAGASPNFGDGRMIVDARAP